MGLPTSLVGTTNCMHMTTLLDVWCIHPVDTRHLYVLALSIPKTSSLVKQCSAAFGDTPNTPEEVF
jgi:hypothetical protein